MARRRMVPPINSVKHYFQRPVTNVGAAAILNETIVDAVVLTAVNLANEVQEGAVIKAVFVETWAIGIGSDGAQSSFNMTLEKVPASAPAMTNAQSLALMTYPNKKNVLYTTQGILGSSLGGGNTTPLLKQWFAIPKGKQRFGLGDKLNLNFSNIATNIYQICGFYTYKEYR